MLQISRAGCVIRENPLKLWKSRRKASGVHPLPLSPTHRIGNQPDRQSSYQPWSGSLNRIDQTSLSSLRLVRSSHRTRVVFSAGGAGWARVQTGRTGERAGGAAVKAARGGEALLAALLK